MTSRLKLRKPIGDAPIRGNLPRHDRVVGALHAVVMVIVRRHIKHFGDLGSSWLNLPEFVDATGHQHTRLSVPLPVHTKTGVRHFVYLASNLSILPGASPISGYFHLTNGSSAGPRQTRDLIGSTAGQLVSSGWKRDHRFRSPLESQRSGLRIVGDVSVVVVGHVVPVNNLHAS